MPNEVRSRLQLPAADEGIDLLAETHSGDLWAIQCKFHADPDRAVTRQELGTFVALASVTGLPQRVVAHTSSKPIRKRSLLGDTVEIGLDRWLSLDETSWSLITAAVQGCPARPEPALPRPHQQEAIAAARRHYLDQRASRGRLIMPCGTGKSLTAFWIAEALDARTILVAVPSLSLIRQSLADWTREYLARGEVPEWLCVCIDDSVGAVESDSFVAETYDRGPPDHDKPPRDCSVPVPKRQTLLRGVAVCEVDERTPDILHNRILRETLLRLATCGDMGKALRHELRVTVRRMRDVSRISLTSGVFRRVQLSRNTVQYGLLMRICEMVFHALMPDEQGQGSRFLSILDDEIRMSALFEEFLRKFYNQELPGYRAASEIMSWDAGAEHKPDLDLLPKMRTDIMIRSRERLIIVDAKYV